MTLVFFSMKHCPWCDQIKRLKVLETFKKLRPDIPVESHDLTAGETELSQFLGVRSVPAFVLVGPDGSGVKKTRGFKTAEQLAKWVD